MAHTKGLFVLLLFGAVLTVVPTFLEGQQHKGQGAANSTGLNAILAKPVEWNDNRIHLFKDDSTQIIFSLSTSWIPGEDRKGKFRYKLSVTVPQHGEGVTVDSIAATLRRTQACKLSLVLHDKYDFQLREIQLTLHQGVDDAMNLKGLWANDSVPMEADEYKSLIGNRTPDGGGNWNITWDCSVHD